MPPGWCCWARSDVAGWACAGEVQRGQLLARRQMMLNPVPPQSLGLRRGLGWPRSCPGSPRGRRGHGSGQVGRAATLPPYCALFIGAEPPVCASGVCAGQAVLHRGWGRTKCPGEEFDWKMVKGYEKERQWVLLGGWIKQCFAMQLQADSFTSVVLLQTEKETGLFFNIYVNK